MRAAASGRHAVVAGTANAAQLRSLLAHHGIRRTTLLTTQRFLHMPPGMDSAVVQADAWRETLPHADHALLVYGAPRREREALLWRPDRHDLVALATALHARGVRTLQLQLHPGVAPLNAGERRALKALGLDPQNHARPGPAMPAPSGPWPARLAGWMIHVLLTTMQQLSATRSRHRRDRPR